MGRYFDAVLSAVCELRHGNEHHSANTVMQSVLCNEACVRLQSGETKAQRF